MSEPSKICASCGRAIEWRKKWADCWDEIRYCSAGCRKKKVSEMDESLEAAILRSLDQRAGGATICPSEIARSFFGEEAWRENMERTRCAARRLVDKGSIVICQKGKVVDPSTAKGPIRLRKR